MNSSVQSKAERRTSKHNRNLVFNPGKRNTIGSRQRRPRCTRRSMHVVLKSDIAKGMFNLRRHKEKIRRLIFKLGFKNGVRVYRLVNVGNHIHISIKLMETEKWKGFISGVSGGIASIVGFKTCAARKSFWNSRPFTRAVNWGQDYRQLKLYFDYNFLQTTGLIPLYKPKNWRRVVELLAEELPERRARSQFVDPIKGLQIALTRRKTPR